MDEHGLISITVHGIGEISKNEAFNQILLYIFVAGFFFIGVFVVKDIMKSKELICKKEGETCDEVYCYKLKEHDFKYGIGILLLLMIFICTIILGNNNTVMEYISFAGTVSSLILSVLAIMMTILSEANSNVANTKIDNHLNLVQQLHEETGEQIEQIKSLTDELEKKQKSYDQMIEKLDNIMSTETKVMNYIKSLNDKINTEDFSRFRNVNWTNSQYESEQQNRREKNG